MDKAKRNIVTFIFFSFKHFIQFSSNDNIFPQLIIIKSAQLLNGVIIENCSKNECNVQNFTHAIIMVRHLKHLH